MSEVRIRKVDEWVVDSLRRQARSHGQTLETSLRELLLREAMRPKQKLGEELRAGLKELEDKYGTFSDSAPLIREEREKRW